MAKTALLRALGYTVVEMWECDWGRQVKHDPQVQQFLSTLEIIDPLDPQDAFFGRSTGAASLYYMVDENKGEQIRYVDVRSEYPWLNTSVRTLLKNGQGTFTTYKFWA